MIDRETEIRAEISMLKQTKAVLVEQIVQEFDAIDKQIRELREELKECKRGKRKVGNGG